jgi:hypothetical protein
MTTTSLVSDRMLRLAIACTLVKPFRVLEHAEARLGRVPEEGDALTDDDMAAADNGERTEAERMKELRRIVNSLPSAEELRTTFPADWIARAT